MAVSGPRKGRVAAFDERRGLGEVEDAGDARRYPFHCSAVTDGTRSIAEGAEVTFVVVPGLLGRWEAAQVEKH